MYATVADMLRRMDEVDLVQLANADDIASATPRIETELSTASNIINGYVAAKYRVTPDPVPPMLVDLACDIAKFRLYRDQPTEAATKAHSAAMATLRDIAKGHIRLDNADAPIAERSGAILVDRPERLFGRDSMSGF